MQKKKKKKKFYLVLINIQELQDKQEQKPFVHIRNYGTAYLFLVAFSEGFFWTFALDENIVLLKRKKNKTKN